MSEITTNSEMFSNLLRTPFSLKDQTLNLFGNKSVFQVRILTKPEAYSGPAAVRGESSSVTNDTVASKYLFKGRILDRDMAHQKFLQDPCDESVADDPAAVARLVQLHSTIILTDTGDFDDLQIGDIIYAEAGPGDNNNLYDLQNLTFVGVHTKFGAASNEAAVEDCPNLGQLIDGWEGSTVGGGTGAGSGFSPDVPNIELVDSNYVTTPIKCPSGTNCDYHLQAKWYTGANRTVDDIRIIVIHAVGCPPQPGKAKFTAEYFQNPSYKSSAHYTVDQGGAVWQSVHPEDVSWHGSNTNFYSLGIEHAGAFEQYHPTDDWTPLLYDTSARLAASLAVFYDIPVVKTEDPNGSGFLAHGDIPQKHPHPDPYIYWDWDYYINLVQSKIDEGDYGDIMDKDIIRK